MSGYVKTFKVKDGDKDKNKKLMSFHIDDEKLLEKYITIWIKIEDFKNIKLNALPVYDERYRKNKLRTYDDEVYTNFCSSNVPKDKFFTLIPVDPLLVYKKKHYLQVYLDNCTYNIANKQMIHYLDDSLFETDED